VLNAVADTAPDVVYCEAFERSFSFSEFQSLQEVGFGVSWIAGGLLWIPAALSTLRRATSPRLSALHLNFVDSSTITRSLETAIEGMGDDLQRTADEVARIEHEYEGAVKVIVFRDPRFKTVFDALNVRFYFCGLDGAS
jgi:hypothetical protein